ncbi:MAG: polyprenyl diphosphate synthase [Bacteroides sp.]|nr:polyprenyl diphosphate synthase [Bacillota bacterium]MCM1394029.1 polyprenyl diphosphate synthase [[Eubacterium] siraeum]MCM1455795.1 polyprenyl diphosphate synthase [Bacteroides sp.]
MPLRHIAFIMDGNGRWATARSLPRTEGYSAGLDALKRVADECARRGVEVVSVYAFSTENNARPEAEKQAIFDVVKKFNASYDGDMRILYMGDVDALPADVAESVRDVEYKTANNVGLTLNIALNYGAKDDIIHACKLTCDHGDFTVEGFESNLATCGLPALDAIVRTGGEKRLSNFMLYECAYAELFFIDKLWPDMSVKDVDNIIVEFEHRNRKFGK